VTSGDPEIDKLVEILKIRILQESNEAHNEGVQSVRNQMAARGLLNSGMAAKAVLDQHIAYLDRVSERLKQELFGLAKKANGGTLPREAETWIAGTLEESIESLGRSLVARVQDDRLMRPVEHLQEELERVITTRRAQARQAIAYEIGLAGLESRSKQAEAVTFDAAVPAGNTMLFADLTNDRSRGLILALLEAMDPKKYAFFLAAGSFDGWSITLLGVGAEPQKDLPEWSGKFEEADLFELRDARYVQLWSKQHHICTKVA